MVESNNTIKRAKFAEVGEMIELHHFHNWNEYTDEDAECDDEKATENADVVEGELESLESILTPHEYEKVEKPEDVLASSAKTALKDVLHAMHLSIVP